MKVLLAAHPHYSGEALAKALRALGHDALFFNHTYPPWRWRWLGVMVRRLPILGSRYPSRLKWLVRLESWAISQAFERAAGRFRPDAIIVVKGDLLDPGVLDRVRDRHGVPMGCYFGDCLCSPPAAAVARQIAPHYDVFFLPDEMEVLDSIPVSARRTARALCGVDPDQFTPVQLSEADRERYESDVAFAGVLRLYRYGVIKRLFDMPIRLKLWGGVTPEVLKAEPSIAGRVNGWVSPPEMIKIYAGAKIVLNVHGVAGGLYHGLPMRVFEATACGAFLITDDCVQLRKCFDVGREVAAYSTPDELVSQVRYYLERPDLRREMAARARERTLREHTWKERLRGILEVLTAERRSPAERGARAT